MNEIEAAAIRQACAELVSRFHVHLDRMEMDRVLDLFAEDGVWDQKRVGLLEGRAAIRDYLASKPPLLARHVVTNIVIDVVDESHAEGSMYFTYYRAAEGASPPAVFAGPSAMGEYRDRFVRTAAGWKFAHRDPQTLFRA